MTVRWGLLALNLSSLTGHYNPAAVSSMPDAARIIAFWDTLGRISWQTNRSLFHG